MKKYLLIIAFLVAVSRSFALTQISNISYPSTVNLFDLFEISFDVNVLYSNPYDPRIVEIYAEIISPNNESYRVDAFYYEGYSFQETYCNIHDNTYETATQNNNNGWRIRFTPNCVGNWCFLIRGVDINGTIKTPETIEPYIFSCTSVLNAKGFISIVNNRFLKRDVVENGQRKSHSFFPIGPNVAWYNCLSYCDIEHPRGIYAYEDHIDSLYTRANYMRIWINRYQYLSLYGPEFTQLENNQPKVYFDSIINQKDAAELDHIISYASQHDISVLLSVFNQNDFITSNDNCNPSIWANNPFNYILNLNCPCDFFIDSEAKRITKNLIRYIVSRWGYATNIMCWELWNEVDHATKLCSSYNAGDLDQYIQGWHDEMTNYIRITDPFGHCITSSVGSTSGHPPYLSFFQNLDFVQRHSYQNIQSARSKFELPYSIFLRANNAHNITMYQSKPFFMGEFGFSHSKHPRYTNEKDPKGVSLHNSLWSSLFSASIGPASLWWWDYLDSCAMYNRFVPITNFCQTLPILSESFTEHTTGTENNNDKIEFDNGLATYYMINGSEDTIMGWSQDTAFAYQALRRLTDSLRIQVDTLLNGTIKMTPYFKDSVPPFDPNGYIYTLNPLKRPAPSSNSNIITLPITNQPIGSRYLIKWYDSETGYAINTGIITYSSVHLDSLGNRCISFEFPSSIRDIRSHTINNTFGDAVFVLVLKNKPQ